MSILIWPQNRGPNFDERAGFIESFAPPASNERGQNDPSAEPRPMTTISAAIAPMIPTMTMSK